MTRLVQWSRAAIDALQAQVAYIAAENPAAAHRVADRIHATCAALGEMATGRPGRVSAEWSLSRDYTQ